MKSMTGYGHAECARDGYKVSVEISSVNRKQLDLLVVLPRDLEVLEAQMRDVVAQSLSRGKVTVRVTLHLSHRSGKACPRLNHELARAYLKELQQLARELKLTSPVTLDLVVQAPGVLESDEEALDAETFWPALHTALRQALEAMLRTRQREGAHLEKDLARRVALMRRSAARIRRRAPLVQKRYRQQLVERLRAAGLAHLPEDDERLLKEIVLFADRSDISEELARLESHFQQFEDARRATEPVGRLLDFLAQEMNREINTIGSKANDALIAREVVLLKTELEKFREQAMNVE
ncbi:MAG: YicC family protein [Verrucomicrobiae bacterium]|nr:YicC family protein [Verrucomicrobiae bacterium]